MQVSEWGKTLAEDPSQAYISIIQFLFNSSMTFSHNARSFLSVKLNCAVTASSFSLQAFNLLCLESMA